MKTFAKILLIAAVPVAFTSACNSDAKTRAQINLQAYKDSVKRVEDSAKLDSFNRAEAVKQEVKEQRAAQPVVVERRTTTYVAPEETTTAAPAKKGWSSAAKGAAIGAGAGAVTGILVDKKDGRGAVIGGVVGAGTGYIIGRGKDKKSGRAQ